MNHATQTIHTVGSVFLFTSRFGRVQRRSSGKATLLFRNLTAPARKKTGARTLGKAPEVNQIRHVGNPCLLTQKRPDARKGLPSSDLGEDKRTEPGWRRAISVTILTLFANIVGDTVVVLKHHPRKVALSRTTTHVRPTLRNRRPPNIGETRGMSAPRSAVLLGGETGGAGYLLTLDTCPTAVGIFTVRPRDPSGHSHSFTAMVWSSSRDHHQCLCWGGAGGDDDDDDDGDDVRDGG